MEQRGVTRRTAIAGAAAGAAVAAAPSAAQGARRKKPPRRTADVIVVGAGLAGLVAAQKVKNTRRKVLVLEARDRVGGRLLSEDVGGGEVAELGGMFTGPTQNRIQALAADHGVELYPTYNTGNNVFNGANNRRSEFPNDTPLFGAAPPDPIVAGDIAAAVAQLDDMAAQVPVDKPWTAPQAAEWDGQTLETWLRENTSGSEEFLAVVSAATEAIFGAEPRDLSLLFTLYYIAASGDEQNVGTFERNFNTGGGAQEQRFTGGAQEVAVRAAARLGKYVVLNAPVTQIRRSNKSVKVVTDQFTAYGKRVIVAIPPTLAGKIDYVPGLPALREQLTQRTPQGSLRKIEAVYDTPFWRAKGLSGQAVSESGPVKVTYDVSPPDGSPGIMMGFIGGSEARKWGQRSEAERREAAIANFVQYFGEEARNPRSIVEFDWTTERYTGGCPTTILPPGVLLDFGEALARPVGRIHWAGTETSDYWNGYMDGAVRSGERAAKEVLAGL